MPDNTGPTVTAVAVSPAPQSLSISGIAGTARWSLTLAPGATTVLNVVIAIGDTSTGRALTNPDDANSVLSATRTTLTSFQSVFTAAQTGWSDRWYAAFTPGNPHYSGSLPVITTDHPAIDRLYYMSVLSVLAAERTNLGPAFSGFLGRPSGGFRGFDRIYTTGANEFGGTTMFFWDTSYASVLLALLDPVMLKAITSYCSRTSDSTVGRWASPSTTRPTPAPATSCGRSCATTTSGTASISSGSTRASRRSIPSSTQTWCSPQDRDARSPTCTHARGLYEHLRADLRETVISLARSAWAGSQRYGAALWSGDIPTTFEPWRLSYAQG